MSKKRDQRKPNPKVIIKTTNSKLMVSVPPAMHVALEAEAAEEGVPLNELVIAKLAIGLSKKQPA